MLIVGLTGSIGMGKSTAAARFRALGINVFDADAKVHDLYDRALSGDVEAAFPGTTKHGRVDRAKLSAALLASPHKLSTLEAIVHPRVREAEGEFLQHEFARGAKMAVLEIPLLFETNAEKLVDLVIVVSAPEAIQKARVLARPGMSDAKLAKLLQRQLPDEEKVKRADFVVDTSGSVESCEAQVDAIVSALAERRGDAFQRHWG
jgi:dephospho-CoA kinase